MTEKCHCVARLGKTKRLELRRTKVAVYVDDGNGDESGRFDDHVEGECAIDHFVPCRIGVHRIAAGVKARL